MICVKDIPKEAAELLEKVCESISSDIQKAIEEECVQMPSEVSLNESDGAICDQTHHEILYEDATIRVINVTVPAQAVETPHTHQRSAVMYVDKPATIQLIEWQGQSAKTLQKTSITDLKSRLQCILFEDFHWIRNKDNKLYAAFRIEVKPNIAHLSPQSVSKLSQHFLKIVDPFKGRLDQIRICLLDRSPEKNTCLSQYVVSEQPNDYTPSFNSVQNEKDDKFEMAVGGGVLQEAVAVKRVASPHPT